MRWGGSGGDHEPLEYHRKTGFGVVNLVQMVDSVLFEDSR